MNRIELHDAFVPEGCAVAPVPAVTLDAGCMWIDAYTAVTTKAGRYVQGGGCTTVGVAGLVQGGGFGSFSKRYGLAAASLLQAEIVTADGVVRTVNACQDPDLFWALKGGGGGSFGVVTRLTLQTHDLPERFGFVGAKIKASSPDAYSRLVGRFVDHYAEALFNPHWGEAFNLYKDEIEISMVCQGLDTAQAKAVWAPSSTGCAPRPRTSPSSTSLTSEPARRGTGGTCKNNPAMVLDERPDAEPGRGWWKGDQDQVSALPARLRLAVAARVTAPARPAGAPGRCARGGEPADDRAAALQQGPGRRAARAERARRAGAPPTRPWRTPSAWRSSRRAAPRPSPACRAPSPTWRLRIETRTDVAKAAETLKAVAPAGGSYISETDFFRPDWREAFWGPNYPRLKAIKDRYDPDGFFFVHHGVGSEDWSPDGFTRIA